MSRPVAFAVAAHPDDIELMMGGTLLMLGKAGFDVHYMNLCNGSMGTDWTTRESIIAQRTEEARQAARTLGATFHEPIADDLDLFYDRVLPRKVCAVIRDIKPRILLVQSPQDYMEDHMNACRIAVSAAFFRGMCNFMTDPPRLPAGDPVTVYHALPWGLRDPLRRVVRAGQYVDITSVLKTKREALACHKTQKEWLDRSQGLDSYLTTLEEMSALVGRMSGKYEYAEGWRRHLHLGFCGEEDDPLTDALPDASYVCQAYQQEIDAGMPAP